MGVCSSIRIHLLHRGLNGDSWRLAALEHSHTNTHIHNDGGGRDPAAALCLCSSAGCMPSCLDICRRRRQPPHSGSSGHGWWQQLIVLSISSPPVPRGAWLVCGRISSTASADGGCPPREPRGLVSSTGLLHEATAPTPANSQQTTHPTSLGSLPPLLPPLPSHFLMPWQRFVDRTRVYAKGGTGGQGSKRNGDGGDGGDVLVVARDGTRSLSDAAATHRFEAAAGKPAARRQGSLKGQGRCWCCALNCFRDEADPLLSSPRDVIAMHA